MQIYVNSLVTLGTKHFNSPLVKHKSRLVKYLGKTPTNTLFIFGYCVGESVSMHVALGHGSCKTVVELC